MRPNHQAGMNRLANWIELELVPPVVRWVQIEKVPLEARALQARARRALSIGEVSAHVHNVVMMQTDSIIRFCAAEVVGQISAWGSDGHAYLLSPKALAAGPALAAPAGNCP